ncbi:MAG: helix-turn-helix transcriptional regulator [Chloroflexi bacterium]|nr:helix-turn-helix transcriptional regulator [Chloroflexota bacterium]
MMEDTEPCYVISVAAKMIGVHAQTLRYYERVGLIDPHRSKGNIRFYSVRDIEKLKRIKALMNDLGVNLAGVEVVIRMAERMAEMERSMREMEQYLQRMRGSTSQEKVEPFQGETPRRGKKSIKETVSSTESAEETIRNS